MCIKCLVDIYADWMLSHPTGGKHVHVSEVRDGASHSIIGDVITQPRKTSEAVPKHAESIFSVTPFFRLTRFK